MIAKNPIERHAIEQAIIIGDLRTQLTVKQRELDGLRLSVKRIAQHIGIKGSDIPYHDFDSGDAPMPTSERGWNRLCAIIINELEDVYGINHCN